MSKPFFLTFGSANPADNSGLTPTLITFVNVGGSIITGPTISEVNSTGFYHFTYGPTLPIVFTADGGAGLSGGDRYVSGVLDPIATVDQKVGTIDDSFGSTSVDPTTLFGHAKRNQEWLEGNANFNKTSGLWDVYSRGSSTLLSTKTLSNNTSQATKT